MNKEAYEKPELTRHENLKTITLVSTTRISAQKHELYIGDEE